AVPPGDVPRVAANGLGAGQGAAAADAVAADVHQPAALEIGLQADVVGVAGVERERGAGDAQLADVAGGEELPGARQLRVVAPHERLLQHAPLALGDVEGALDLLGVTAHRLLAQHVLAG